VQSVDAGNEHVRTQTANVPAERCNGAVCCDEQRQDVEAVEAFSSLEPRVGAGGGFDKRHCVRAVPGMTVDPDPATTIEAGVKPEQPVLAPRRAYALGTSHPDGAIAGNAAGAKHRRGEGFTRERFDWIPPEPANEKCHFW